MTQDKNTLNNERRYEVDPDTVFSWERKRRWIKPYEIVLICLIVMMLIPLFRHTFFPPLREHETGWHGLPVEAADICSVGNPGKRWLECTMPEDVFLHYAEKQGYVLTKIEDEPVTIGRYTSEKKGTEGLNADSHFHVAENGYWMEKPLLKIVYDSDKNRYFEEWKR